MENKTILNPETQVQQNHTSPHADPPKKSHRTLVLAVIVTFLISIFGGITLGKYLFNPQTPMVQPTLIPKPTVIPTVSTEAAQTANWKTYTNQKFNLLVKYPQNWNVNSDKNGLVISGDNNTITIQSSPYPSIDFDKLYEKPDGTVDKNPVFIRTKIKNLEIDGYKATMYSNENTQANQNKAYDISVYIIKGAPITMISTQVDLNLKSNFLPTFNQILSTFKFLDVTPTPPTTYTACGCGCCTEAIPPTKCLYKSKGDSLERIIEEDQKVKNSPQCATVGCSSGILYKYCD
jgi:hypothetical protein